MNLDRLITETLRRRLLVENAINNSRKAARDMVIDRFDCTEEYANNVLEEIRILVGLEDKMRKFIKGCTRMFLNGEFKDQRILGDFKDALNKIKTDGHIGEFDSDLRRLDQPENAVNSAKDIISIFKPEIDRERAEQRQKLSGMEFVPNTDYEIVKIDSFEEARKYSRYTSWCVTRDEIYYNNYITNGINQFYFCLQKGFKKIKKNGNFDDKKDDYALSMLAILVNPEGELIHCTNRKNNDQGVLNPMEISELVGRNFYETFKPNTTWRDTLEDVKKKLDNGVPVEKVFEGVRRDGDLVFVSLLRRWNILVEGNTFLCGRWYDSVGNFSEGFVGVKDRTKGWNFINREGNELCNRWYDIVGKFNEGFAIVLDYNKGWNFINRDGEEICDRCYNNAWPFSDGFGMVWNKNKGWNFINRDGKEVCDRWYDGVGDFCEGFAKVKDNNNGFNFINREGKEIGDRWYDGVYDFCEGFAIVIDNNKGLNFINHEGKEIGDRWYYDIKNFSEGFAGVKYKGKWYLLRKDGVLCGYKTRKPLEDTPAQMAEAIIDRLVRDVLSENRKRHYL